MAFTTADALLAVSAVILAFNLFLGLAGLAAPLLACLVELAGLAKKQVFYRKTAQQLSVMGLSAGVYMLVVLGGTWVLVLSRAPDTPLPDIRALLGLSGLAALVLWLVASLAYVFTWKSLNEARGLHAVLGLAAGAGGLTSIVRLVLALLPLSLPPAKADTPPVLDLAPLLAPSAALAVVLALALAGTAGLVYILYRRNRDDWGRDYYTFALKLCAKWTALALLAAIAGLAGLGYTVLLPLLADELRALGLPLGLGAGAGLIACGLLAALWQSATPLRQKLLVALAAPLVWALLSGLAYAALRLALVA